MSENREVVLAARPQDHLDPSHFRVQDAPMPRPGPGEVLVRVLWLSVDPANRAWMSPVPTYVAPVKPGDVFPGFGLGEVVASEAAGFAPGDLVEGVTGWRRFAALPAKGLRRLKRREPVGQHLSVLGITGKTAWFGLEEIGRLKPGETVVVSAAAGAVGSIAGQLARIAGARVIGIAGGPAKCRHVVGDLGFDGAIDYKAEGIGEGLKRLGVKGVDVYFDNVGGPMLESLLFRMASFGRIVCCGNVSQYDTATPAPGPRGVPGLLVVKRIRMEGFIVLDYEARYDEAEAALAGHVDAGRIRYFEDVLEGIEKAPEGLVRVLAGGNVGKTMIRLA